MSPETKTCLKCKNDFTIEPNDFGFYEKMGVPSPDNCPLCRQQLRTTFRNFKTLYKRKCDKSGKMIVSIFNPDAKFPVYDISEWWSDDWDAMDYGTEIDFERSFFEQFAELLNKVPHLSLWNVRCENSQYSNQIDNSRNCYLIFGGLNDEDCDYGHIVWNCRDAVDNLYLFKSEACYECSDCLNSNKLLYSEECDGCAESIGLFDCRGCLNCIGCVGLVNKSYCIFNEQKTKAEYEKFIEENPLHNPETIKYILAKKEELKRKLPQRSFFGFRNNNVSGNHIYNAHNVHYSFDIKSGENSKFCFTVREAIDSYDLSFTGDASECYQSLTILGSNKAIGSQTLVDCHDVLYSEACFNSDNLFGCYGLRKKSYCIFNKQYSKEDYFALRDKLIEKMKKDAEWGKFLPPSMSPFSYNEAIVNEYMPLTKEEALEQGFRWRDDIPSTSGQQTMHLNDLPIDPKDYSDKLANEVLECEKCHKNYRFISREIGFYKKMGLSLPKQCFNCRHERRMKARNPRSLWNAKCVKCGNDIKTSYPSEKQKIYQIYCEKCYQQEVY